MQDDRLKKLKQLYPEIYSNGEPDWEALKTILIGKQNQLEERYGFTWPGKKEAQQILQRPPNAGLKPVPKESVDFKHSTNLFIEGENLEVLKILQKSYFGKVKIIFIDPPYNTGKDFLYPDNWKDPLADYLRLTGQVDEGGLRLTSNPETGGRFHSRWLSMMYPRLFLSRNLLKEDGVIFVSIDDTEVHHLRIIMNEIFGEENFVANIIWQKKYSPANDARYLSDNHDHILLYARNKETWKPRLLPRTSAMDGRYKNPDNDPRGVWKPGGFSVKTYSREYDYPIETPSGKFVNPPKGSCWQTSKKNYQKLLADDRIWFGKNGDAKPQLKQFLSEVQQGSVAKSIWLYNEVGHNQTAKAHIKQIFHDSDIVFDTPKPVELIQRMLELSTYAKDEDIVLDFFAGSASTAHAVLLKNAEDGGNRKFLVVQLPEPLPRKDKLSNGVVLKTIADIGKERLRRVIRGYAGVKGIPGGFKVFRLQASVFINGPDWPAKSVKEISKALRSARVTMRTNVPRQDILYEILLMEGWEPCSEILEKKYGNNLFYHFKSGTRRMLVCLDKKISPKATEWLVGYAPNCPIICLDSALTDSQKILLSSQVRLKTV
jgi:adenine-specific DNA-methyltransferase